MTEQASKTFDFLTRSLPIIAGILLFIWKGSAWFTQSNTKLDTLLATTATIEAVQESNTRILQRHELEIGSLNMSMAEVKKVDVSQRWRRGETTDYHAIFILELERELERILSELMGETVGITLNLPGVPEARE